MFFFQNSDNNDNNNDNNNNVSNIQSQCGNLRNFQQLRFYVKSIFVANRVSKIASFDIFRGSKFLMYHQISGHRNCLLS